MTKQFSIVQPEVDQLPKRWGGVGRELPIITFHHLADRTDWHRYPTTATPITSPVHLSIIEKRLVRI
jgi:hypothetical protein